MPKVQILNQQGENVGELELNEAIFGADVNEHVVYEVVRNQLANKRQGTQSAKTRSEVRGGGKKPWRQKVQVEQDKDLSDLHNGEVVG